MNRDQFYLQIQKWEKARIKWIIPLFIYIGFMMFSISNINKFFSFSIQTPLQAGLIIGALSIPAICLFAWGSNQTKTFNLICQSCNFPFEHYRQFTHIAFTNKCPKCGANVYSV